MLKINEGSAAHWAIRALWVAAVVAFVLYIPTKTETGTIGDITLAFEYITCAIGLNLVLGYTGIISIGHSFFYGIGGYATGILVTRYGWDPGWTIYFGVILAFVVGCVVALPALRLQGVYLALVTLSLAVLFPSLVKWQKLAWLTNGPRGINGVSYDEIPTWPILGELSGREGRAVFSFWLAFVVLVVSYVVCRGIVKSSFGRSLVAIRDNDTAAAVMGVNRTTTKMLVFGTSAGDGRRRRVGRHVAHHVRRTRSHHPHPHRWHHLHVDHGARWGRDAVGSDRRWSGIRVHRLPSPLGG